MKRLDIYRCLASIILLPGLIFCVVDTSYAQNRFECTTDLWMLEEGTERLVTMRINPANSSIQIQSFIDDTGGLIDAIAFNREDGLLYGLNAESWELYTIDPAGEIDFQVTLSLTAGLRYETLVFDKDGKLVTVGSSNELDRSIAIVDLRDNYKVETINITGAIYASDYTIDPVSGLLYGYNQLDENIFSFDVESLKLEGVAAPVGQGNAFQGVYFDSFGDLYAFGSTAFGVASALFKIDRIQQKEIRLSTGPESYIRDFANCPYRSDIRFEVNPKFSFPCNIVEYDCNISNSSGMVLDDLDLKAYFPSGLRIDRVQEGNVDGNFSVSSYQIDIKNLKLEQGGAQFKAFVEVEDVFEGFYESWLEMKGLPVFLGVDVKSDNPVTIIPNDKTKLEIKRIDADSIFVSAFFCRDQEAELDASIYGSNVQWENGSTQALLQVDESGIYTLEAQGGCSTTTVVFEVTIASCPYNIEMNHIINPDTIYPCSESYFYFIIHNETGNEYAEIDFIDTLPEGFRFVDFAKNPYRGNLNLSLDERAIHIENMIIPDGLDTLIIQAYIADVDPATYRNQARIRNFPTDLGNFRLSDFPNTPQLDSTDVVVLGVDSDSTLVDRVLCKGESIILDGRPYGTEFLWFNGTDEAEFEVDKEGLFELQVFSGCEVSYVFFDVNYGPDIDIEISTINYEVHLGDSLQFFPHIYSENGISELEWYDPQDSTISCQICLEPFVRPYFDNIYTLRASNGQCRDSIDLFVKVDKTRKIYAPNIFNPNDSGINGLFFLQSPDFAFVEQIRIVDRWGNEAFEESSFIMEAENGSWDGWSGNSWAEAGVYMWQASIRFLDNEIEVFSGAITLLD